MSDVREIRDLTDTEIDSVSGGVAAASAAGLTSAAATAGTFTYSSASAPYVSAGTGFAVTTASAAGFSYP